MSLSYIIHESGFRQPLCTYRLNWARRTSWGWWDDWDDNFLQTQIQNSSPGGLRPSIYPSVTEAPHNTDFHTWKGKKHFCCFFQTAETGNRAPNSGVKGSGANHYPRAPDTDSVHYNRGVKCYSVCPANIRCVPKVGLMLANRLVCRTNIETTFAQCLVFAVVSL